MRSPRPVRLYHLRRMLYGTVPLLTPCSKSHLESLTTSIQVRNAGPANGFSPGPIGGPMGARQCRGCPECHPFVPTWPAPPLLNVLNYRPPRRFRVAAPLPVPFSRHGSPSSLTEGNRAGPTTNRVFRSFFPVDARPRIRFLPDNRVTPCGRKVVVKRSGAARSRFILFAAIGSAAT